MMSKSTPNGFLEQTRAGFSSSEPTLGEVLRNGGPGAGGDRKQGDPRSLSMEMNPFQAKLNEASQRLRNAQIAMMRNGGGREKMELELAKKAFETAHTIAIQFDNPVPSPNFSTTSRRSDSGYDTDSSQSVSSNSFSERHHPYARRLSKKERNKISATKYRQKKKMYMTELENKCKQLSSTVDALRQAMTALQSENKLLKEQLGFLKGLIEQKGPSKVQESKMEQHKEQNYRNSFGIPSGSPTLNTGGNLTHGNTFNGQGFNSNFNNGPGNRHKSRDNQSGFQKGTPDSLGPDLFSELPSGTGEFNFAIPSGPPMSKEIEMDIADLQIGDLPPASFS
mmetsp:Transcript_16390/g.40403  ORF Transcript_16390/g.40403 Transcript_16390/m.40403 type:complete len:337 (-) Transcript_16390:270-1280(-)